MKDMQFDGSTELFGLLDAAVHERDVDAVTQTVKRTLCRLIRSTELPLPQALLEAHPEHYRRRLLHRSPEHGYSVIAMTWGPGQGTPLHDHAGLWCVEGVWAGRLRVISYELLGEDARGARFEKREVIEAGFGSGGSLIPPYEYHVIENASSEEVAVSIHVYGGEMNSCSAFLPLGGDLYRRERRTLAVDLA